MVPGCAVGLGLGPSLTHVPAMLEFQVCNEVLYMRDVKCCVGHCTGDLLI